MPLRDYRCEKCLRTFEVLFRTTEPQPKEVECQYHDCDGIAKRIVPKTDFLLKGSGWYATDYKSKRGKDV
jgi:putative FmdB family regulatory protein